jgi:hypothetical protein
VHARAPARKGRYDETSMWATQAPPDSVRDAGGGRVMQVVYAALANPAKRLIARRALRDFVPTLTDTAGLRLSGVSFVVAFTMIGDIYRAYALAGRVADQFPRAPSITIGGDAWAPEMRPFRQNARFQAFVTRVKPPDYWMAYGRPDDCDFKDGRLTCH